jgi:hypothetical protein
MARVCVCEAKASTTSQGHSGRRKNFSVFRIFGLQRGKQSVESTVFRYYPGKQWQVIFDKCIADAWE